MPSTYAHFRFGNNVVKKLPEEIQKIIRDNKELYLIGLHGPDIFFYYKPLKLNKVSKVGFGMHDLPAKAFFERGRKVIRKLRGEERDKAIAYMLGFICHFTLDSSCHGYIDEKIEESKISHTEIEVEFDSMLMRADGINARLHKLTNHIVPSEKNAEIINYFFPEFTSCEVRKSLTSMKFYNNVLVAPCFPKRQIVLGILKLSGNYDEMHGLIVNPVPNRKCRDSNERLTKLYKKGLVDAVMLIEEYYKEALTNEKLSDKYNHTFGAN